MPLSARCKKCSMEVPAGACCPRCGGKLGPARYFWRVQRRPVLSWECWNAPMRILLPVVAAVVLMAMAAEAAGEGWARLGQWAVRDLPVLLGGLLGASVLLTGLVLALQGTEVLEIAADKTGLTVTVLLPRPGMLSLLARLRSPALAGSASLRREYGLFLGEKKLTWKACRQVQLWPEKQLMLFYAPARWLQLAIPCDRTAWQELSGLVREKLGKRRDVRLPQELRGGAAAGSAPGSRRKEPPAFPVPVEEIAAMNAEAAQTDSEEEGL